MCAYSSALENISEICFKTFRFFDRIFLGEKICIITELSVMYEQHAAAFDTISFGSVSRFAGSEP